MRYEIIYREDGDAQIIPTAECFDTFEEAVARAEALEIDDIVITDCETFEEYSKCWWCREWLPATDVNETGVCDRCKLAIWSRGEEI